MNPSTFPVRAPKGASVSYVSTWGAPRSGGRTHKGVDIFAPLGAHVYAIESGWATTTDGGLGGVGIAVTTTDKTVYYFAHLSEREGTFPRRVEAGELIGRVGATGNAAGGPPHLHLEIRPQGGEQIDPAPLLQALSLPGGEIAPSPFASAAKAGKAAAKSSRRSAPSTAWGLVVIVALIALSRRRSRRAA